MSPPRVHSAIKPNPTIADGFRKSSVTMLVDRSACTTRAWWGLARCWSANALPGIEHSLVEIHEQVDNEVNHRGEQCDGLYGSVVSCVNRFCGIATDSRPAKDCLGNDSSAEKLSELKPHNCCDGRCRIFQSVYAHDGCW